MDKLLPGLINIIRSYVDYYDPNYDHVDGNDIKKFVHLLLSNSGRDMVAEHVVQNYAKGNDRRTLKLKEREQIIRTSSLNETSLSLQLNKKVYGQHLVIGPIVKYLRGHVEGQPQKATVLALHGLSGTGKNFVSRMVAENMYVKGMESKYVYLLSGTKDFPHESLLEEYKGMLKSKMESAVKECSRSLFIIDEMDKLPPGLIDIIRPYVDYYDQVDGNDYKKFVILLLSNSGGDILAEHVMQNDAKGNDRRTLKMKEIEEIIRISSLNGTNGLGNSSIVKNNLISAYIPFLPLERSHVEKCIVDGLFAKGFYAYEYQVDYETVKLIADEMMFFPNGTKQFSTTGCKRVMEKIDFIMQGEA